MGFSLVATWPLGSYLGHRPDGTAESRPMFPRVFSALVQSAATGSFAAIGEQEDPSFPALSTRSVRSLRWLEVNEPYGMILPGYPGLLPALPSRHVIAYRKEGVFDKKISFAGRVTQRTFADASAITAPISWVWEATPPREIVEHLDALCADVGSLGEAESLAILEIHEDIDPASCTHRIEASSFFDDRGESVEIPAPGRLDALEAQYRNARPAKRPTVARDVHRTGDAGLPVSEVPTQSSLAPRALVPVDAVETEVPWASAILRPIVKGPVIGPEARVRVARDLHRALIATIGQKCPPVVTGRYGQGLTPPPNRVALHYVPQGAPLAAGSDGAAHLLVLIPRAVAASDQDVILDAVARIGELRTPMGILHLGPMELTDGDEVWSPPRDGTHREWRTDPVAIPERQSTAPTRTELLARTAAWALGNVMRGLDAEVGDRSPARRLEWLQEHDGEVLEVASYITPRPARFVHRTNGAMPVMPYTARLDLGDLVPPRTALAIGQSRHLGGGLLIPVDRRATPRRDDVRTDR